MAGRQVTPLESALTELRTAVGHAAPAAAVAGGARAAPGRTRDHRPARRLRPAPAGQHRRTPAGGGRRLDRRREVHAGQLAGRAAGERSRSDPADHPGPGSGAPQRGREVVHRRPHPARARAGHRRQRGRALPAAGGRRRHPAGPGHPGRPRHRLRGDREPPAGRPTAGRRRPVAVRHLGSPLRRRRAVGLPAVGGRAQRGGRGRAGPRAPARDGRRPPAPGPDDERAWPGRIPAVRRTGDRRRRRGAAAGGRGPADPQLAGHLGPGPGEPGRGRPPHAGRSDRVAGRPGPGAGPVRSTSRSRSSTRCAPRPTIPTPRRSAPSAYRARTEPCCAGRCWPAGTSSWGPGSSSARWSRR